MNPVDVVLKKDGEYADLKELENSGFMQQLQDPRDFRGDRDGWKFNFVGFVANSTGSLLVVLPKHFEPDDVPADISRLFRLITRSEVGSTNRYIGSECRLEYVSDYPFAAFYAIYDHYTRWGLDTRLDRRFKTRPPGRASWSKTIQQGSWLPSKGGPIPFPVVHDAGQWLSTFLSDCTVFAIDHTLERFAFLLGLGSTGVVRPDFDLDSHREYIVETLRKMRDQTFRDSTLALIDGLIAFYSAENTGGGFYFKQYSFHMIWEELVHSYLKRRFAGYDSDGKMQFQLPSPDSTQFAKGSFRVNSANPDQELEPDYYAVSSDGNSQYILDAKYYSRLNSLNYKQLSYTMLLDSMLTKDGTRCFERTYSTLLLPAQTSRTAVHFFTSPDRSSIKSDLKVTEEYLCIREVVEDFFRT